MIEAEQVGAKVAGPPFGFEVVLGPDEEPAPRTFLGRIRQPERRDHLAVTAEQRAAALVRVGLDAMPADGVRDTGPKLQRHQRTSFGVRPR